MLNEAAEVIWVITDTWDVSGVWEIKEKQMDTRGRRLLSFRSADSLLFLGTGAFAGRILTSQQGNCQAAERSASALPRYRRNR